MKRLSLLLLTCFCLTFFVEAVAQRVQRNRRRPVRTQRVVRKKKAQPVKPLSVHDRNPYLLCEDTCNHVHGIDMSHYQGEVFWETVGEHSKMAFVYLKATEGSDRIDARYERNIDLAHRYGLKVGSYHFFRPKSPLVQQLANFRRQCLPGEQDLIPMLDVETTAGLSHEAFCDSLHRFLQLLERTYHQKPLVYTYRNFYNKYLQGELNGYPLMIAMYADEAPVLADGRDYTLWQYSQKGRLAGVSGYVDKSRFVGNHTLRELRYRR